MAMSSVHAFSECTGLCKPNKKYKKLTRQDRLKNAYERVVRKLGEEKIREIREAFSKLQGDNGVVDAAGDTETQGEHCRCQQLQKPNPQARADSIILALLAQGLSQIEVISILPVGGSRVSRLAKFDPEKAEKTPRIPWHAASDEDRDAIKRQIMTWDVELSFPCCHRQPLEYIEAEEWLDLYREYKEERCISGERVLSPVRWREYVRAFRPRLRLKTASTDLCSCCSKIDVELNDPTTSDERMAELVLQKETRLEDALRHRRAMNMAIAQYQKAWAPDDCVVDDTVPLFVDPDDHESVDSHLPVTETGTDDDHASSNASGHSSFTTAVDANLPEMSPTESRINDSSANSEASRHLFSTTNIQHKCFTPVTAEKARKIVILCEGYGQAITLPSYKLSNPSVDHFNSDLHLHMFSVCDVAQKRNAIFLYDERTAGKDDIAICSLRWYYHCKFLQNLLQKGITPPTMAVKVMDNIVERNKSQCTLMFDCLLNLLLYDRVANFYLLPGHSHMRPDKVTSSCKRAVNKRNIYVPDQVVDAFNSVAGMRAEFVSPNKKVFLDWESFLMKHLRPLPTGFTENYCFEVTGGTVVYKSVVSDDTGFEHIFCTDVAGAREAILAELLGLPPTAQLADIVSTPPRLPVLEERPIPEYKVKCIAHRLPNIPAEYRAYYPGADGNHDYDQQAASGSGDEAPPVKRKKPVGRPRKSESVSSDS